jgi:hypothetical protein
VGFLVIKQCDHCRGMTSSIEILKYGKLKECWETLFMIVISPCFLAFTIRMFTSNKHIMEQVVLWRVREREEKVKQDVIIIYFYHFRMNEDQSKSVFKANNIFIFYSAGRDNSL